MHVKDENTSKQAARQFILTKDINLLIQSCSMRVKLEVEITDLTNKKKATLKLLFL